MDAAERGAHFGTESFGDIVSGDPASGAIAERQDPVRRIRLRANNNDSLRWEVIRLTTAALWKGCTVDEHEVWREVSHRGWEIPVEQTRLPTAVFSFEEFEDHPAHRRVGDRDQHLGAGVAHRAVAAGHKAILPPNSPTSIR